MSFAPSYNTFYDRPDQYGKGMPAFHDLIRNDFLHVEAVRSEGFPQIEPMTAVIVACACVERPRAATHANVSYDRQRDIYKIHYFSGGFEHGICRCIVSSAEKGSLLMRYRYSLNGYY